MKNLKDTIIEGLEPEILIKSKTYILTQDYLLPEMKDMERYHRSGFWPADAIEKIKDMAKKNGPVRWDGHIGSYIIPKGTEFRYTGSPAKLKDMYVINFLNCNNLSIWVDEYDLSDISAKLK
jgi:hypothetical protein